MNLERALRVTAILGTLMLTAASAPAADSPAVVTSLTGTLKISQNIPCSGVVNVTTTVSGGRIELSPAEGIDVTGGKQFSLSRATLTFTPFSASGNCGVFSGSQNYTEVAVQLMKGAPFLATPAGGGVYNVTIPKTAIEFYEASIVNSGPETGYFQPDQDVTGTIDLVNGTVSLHVVIATSVRFREGCVNNSCIIDETDSGTLTADVSGVIAFPDSDGDGVPDRSDNCRFVPNPTQTPVLTPSVTPPANVTLASCLDHHIGWAQAADVCDGGPVTISNNAPALFSAGANTVKWTAVDAKNRSNFANQIVTVVDTTPPLVSCTGAAPPGGAFQVSASDICGVVTIRLGSYVLGNGETVKIEETGNSEVRLIGTVGPDHIRFFHVGKGGAVVTATDGSGNTASAVCR
jgi:hypothetical protein